MPTVLEFAPEGMLDDAPHVVDSIDDALASVQGYSNLIESLLGDSVTWEVRWSDGSVTEASTATLTAALSQ